MIKALRSPSRKLITSWLTLGILVLTLVLPAERAQAASLTSLSDTMSRLKASTASDHEIKFVTPTGIAAGNTVTLTFSSGFTNVSGGTLVFGDVDFATGSTSNCTSATFTEQTLAASAATTTWGVTFAGQVMTLTSATGTATPGNCVRFRIGTNTSTGGVGTHQISNGVAGSSDTITVGGNFGDTGTLQVDIISDDQVNVTATVDPTLTFTISDNTIGFGSLSTSAAKYANGATTGSASDVAAHNLTVATNAQSGYVLSYNGATLTSGGNTINVATISADADGTPGTEQFAMGFTVDQGSTVVTAYANASNNWSFAAGTTTTIVSRTTPTNTETIAAHYLANIAGSTEAGSYSTNVVYIATGSF
jgi:hypothetical protein